MKTLLLIAFLLVVTGCESKSHEPEGYRGSAGVTWKHGVMEGNYNPQTEHFYVTTSTGNIGSTESFGMWNPKEEESPSRMFTGIPPGWEMVVTDKKTGKVIRRVKN